MMSKDVQTQVCLKFDTPEIEIIDGLASTDHRTRAGMVKKIVLDYLETMKKEQKHE